MMSTPACFWRCACSTAPVSHEQLDAFVPKGDIDVVASAAIGPAEQAAAAAADAGTHAVCSLG